MSSTPSTSRASGPSSSTPWVTSWCAATCSRSRTASGISPFPHDPDLPTLPLLMDPGTVGPLAGGSGRTRIDLLRYRPGKRATVRVTSGDTSVVAKAYHDPTKAAAVAEESVALADAARRAATLRLAPTAAHLDDLGWVVQHPVHGYPLDALVGNTRLCPSASADAVRRAARALAELHATRPALHRVRSVDKELHRFGLRAGRIATVDPRVGDLADRLATRLITVQDHLPAATIGPVHGDCKPSQFLLAPQTVHLLDLDHCGTSDQAADVGTFMATLRQYAVRHVLAGRPSALTDRLPALAEEFLTAYLDAGGRRPREPGSAGTRRSRWNARLFDHSRGRPGRPFLQHSSTRRTGASTDWRKRHEHDEEKTRRRASRAAESTRGDMRRSHPPVQAVQGQPEDLRRSA